MEYIIWFLISFILIYCIYYFLFIRKARRNKKLSSEIQFLVYQYNLDINKFSYRKFIKIVGFVISCNIAIVSTIVGVVDGVIWQILFGFVAVIPMAVISFMILGSYYQKKQLKDNSKELAREKKYLDKKDKKKKGDKKGKKKNG